MPSASRLKSPLHEYAVITADAFRTLVEHCASALPLEACGALAGKPSAYGHNTRIESVYPIANGAARPESSFAFRPDSWVTAYYDMQKNQQELVGFYHSHPRGGLRPSVRDYDGLPPLIGGTYWIVSFVSIGADPAVNAYRVHLGLDSTLVLAEIGIQIA